VFSTAGINATATMCGAPSSASCYVEVRPVDVRAALHEIQICRSGVTFRDVLLEGKSFSTIVNRLLRVKTNCTTCDIKLLLFLCSILYGSNHWIFAEV